MCIRDSYGTFWELTQMITDKNNLHDVDTWMIFKWEFKLSLIHIFLLPQ